MKPVTNFTRLIPIVIALLLIASSILLVVPASREAVFNFLGLAEAKPVYNGFEPFIPFVPGYFPDDFDITHVGTGKSTSAEVDRYSETYSSDTHFFKIIQQQGEGLPASIAASGFTIQGSPAVVEEILPTTWLEGDEIDKSGFDLDRGWLVTLILKEIHIQVVTNLPQEEAVLIAEGLVPAICTTKPTETPGR